MTAVCSRRRRSARRTRADVSGIATIGDGRVEIDGWPGMVGHNWGAENAERWTGRRVGIDGGAGDLDLVAGRLLSRDD